MVQAMLASGLNASVRRLCASGTIVCVIRRASKSDIFWLRAFLFTVPGMCVAADFRVQVCGVDTK